MEDTIELAEVIQATVDRLGVTTLHETHGAKALETFKAHQPEMLLLDIGLPDIIGWKLLDSIKQMEAEKRPYVVVITAYGDPANRLMGKLQDVDAYLIKPFSPDEVERVVKGVFNQTLKKPEKGGGLAALRKLDPRPTTPPAPLQASSALDETQKIEPPALEPPSAPRDPGQPPAQP
ncbi:MAG: response regulator [Anaerolineae bacterium]|nr:response regulator [Anaerolineae bacterium]